jgi:hypothetical protein
MSRFCEVEQARYGISTNERGAQIGRLAYILCHGVKRIWWGLVLHSITSVAYTDVGGRAWQAEERRDKPRTGYVTVITVQST